MSTPPTMDNPTVFVCCAKASYLFGGNPWDIDDFTESLSHAGWQQQVPDARGRPRWICSHCREAVAPQEDATHK